MVHEQGELEGIMDEGSYDVNSRNISRDMINVRNVLDSLGRGDEYEKRVLKGLASGDYIRGLRSEGYEILETGDDHFLVNKKGLEYYLRLITDDGKECLHFRRAI